jgi:SagB-type dehydrogenase family enzyme
MRVRLKIFCLTFLLLCLSVAFPIFPLNSNEKTGFRIESGMTKWITPLLIPCTPGVSFAEENNATYKTYPGAKMIKLPQPNYKGIPVEEAIKKRRSVRSYSKKTLTLPQLSQLLFAAQGITEKSYGHDLRTAPSAGALYPMEVYLVVNNVEGLSRGIYHYTIQGHALELLKEGDFRKEITKAGLGQDMLGEAQVTFILSAVFERTRKKYGDRSLRYIYMEAGHISQNISLQAVSLGLGSVCVGAFYDEQVNRLIGLDGNTESAIYLQAVGTL